MRTIYSIDEAAELTQRSKDDLMTLACAGHIRFWVNVPNDIKIGNVGWGNTEEASDPVNRILNRQAFHLTPIPAPKLDLLLLSQDDCQKLQARGTLRQTVFLRAAVFGPDSQLEVVRPSRPKDDPHGLGKLHSPIRVFAAYEQNVIFQESASNVVVPPKELMITASQLHIAAIELLPYLANQQQQASIQPLSVPEASAAVNGPRTKVRSLDTVSLIIRRLYLAATDDEKTDSGAIWEKLNALARQKPSPFPLIDVVPKGILYEKSPSEDVVLTRKQFGERLRTITQQSKKN